MASLDFVSPRKGDSERSVELPLVTTPDDVMRILLHRCEAILVDEFSSDGDDVTGFIRGWLGIPLPDNDNERPHRLTEFHAKGAAARERFEAVVMKAMQSGEAT